MRRQFAIAIGVLVLLFWVAEVDRSVIRGSSI